MNPKAGSISSKQVSGSERKHVTVLFTDLAGYTEMTERMDPEDVRLILNRVFKRITNIIEKYDGFIERYIGDSVMAVFGIPKAHEDDPVRAIRAAKEIQVDFLAQISILRVRRMLDDSAQDRVLSSLDFIGAKTAERAPITIWASPE